ncbi:MAG: HAD family hydrolase, partial [Lachnospiraceae bacterium]|nr:HAD family hydrolase [Lachnospiraceae bacterium]
RLVELCCQQGIQKILGEYIPTKKNMPVKDLYEGLGFVLREEQEGHQIWEYRIPENYRNRNQVIQVI